MQGKIQEAFDCSDGVGAGEKEERRKHNPVINLLGSSAPPGAKADLFSPINHSHELLKKKRKKGEKRFSFVCLVGCWVFRLFVVGVFASLLLGCLFVVEVFVVVCCWGVCFFVVGVFICC